MGILISTVHGLTHFWAQSESDIGEMQVLTYASVACAQYLNPEFAVPYPFGDGACSMALNPDKDDMRDPSKPNAYVSTSLFINI